MARIARSDHPRILLLADVEHRKVADIAAEYGCTSANIYALLGRLRREAADPRPVPPGTVSTDAAPPPAPTAAPIPSGTSATVATAAIAPVDLFAAPPPSPPPVLVVPAPAPGPRPTPSVVAELPPSPVHPPGGLPGFPRPRSGYGIAMRTADGDESLAPFRSLDELLSAIRPILRTAALSPDLVWFSIQPLDLAVLDLDAA
ncbi:MAG: hypothetical protein INR65_00060 [Gluconacetobacter diazotrophicus]|nr:hypothetical protein [Gluconacetobacter diazotrophicus]